MSQDFSNIFYPSLPWLVSQKQAQETSESERTLPFGWFDIHGAEIAEIVPWQMSLAINAVTSSGIVLAADSRQSYRNQKGMARIGSDTASKLFQLNKRVGCAIAGIAFLPSEGGIKNISAFIDEFKRVEEIERLNVEEVVKKLNTFFDAIDFCTLAIKTTEAIQRFSDGVRMDPGDMPGVGGGIDVAVITRDKGFVWVKKKNIRIDGKEVDIDTLPDLE